MGEGFARENRLSHAKQISQIPPCLHRLRFLRAEHRSAAKTTLLDFVSPSFAPLLLQTRLMKTIILKNLSIQREFQANIALKTAFFDGGLGNSDDHQKFF